jgi:hypothetical protein
MDRAGGSQSVAMSITGHKTLSVYQPYRIVDEDDRRNALERTEASLKAAAPPDITRIADGRRGRRTAQLAHNSHAALETYPHIANNSYYLGSAPGGNRTPDPQIRSLMLYPTELQARQGQRTMRIGFYHRVLTFRAVVGLVNAESLA